MEQKSSYSTQSATTTTLEYSLVVTILLSCDPVVMFFGIYPEENPHKGLHKSLIEVFIYNYLGLGRGPLEGT